LVASARSSALRTNGISRIWSNSHFRRQGFRSVFLEIDAFHRDRRIPVRRGRVLTYSDRRQDKPCERRFSPLSAISMASQGVLEDLLAAKKSKLLRAADCSVVICGQPPELFGAIPSSAQVLGHIFLLVSHV